MERCATPTHVQRSACTSTMCKYVMSTMRKGTRCCPGYQRANRQRASKWIVSIFTVLLFFTSQIHMRDNIRFKVAESRQQFEKENTKKRKTLFATYFVVIKQEGRCEGESRAPF